MKHVAYQRRYKLKFIYIYVYVYVYIHIYKINTRDKLRMQTLANSNVYRYNFYTQKFNYLLKIYFIARHTHTKFIAALE